MTQLINADLAASILAATAKDLQAKLDEAIAALDVERIAKAALAETCRRLLDEIATRDAIIFEKDAKIARLHHDLELSGRSVEKALEALHSTTRNEPERKPTTELVGDRLVHR